MALQLVLVLVSLTLRTAGARVAGWVHRQTMLVSLHQRWNMFSPDPGSQQIVLSARGITTDGAAVDVLAQAAPKLVADRSFLYSRWYKFRVNLQASPRQELLAVGRYLCRRYNGEVPGPKLASFIFGLSWRLIPPPGGTFGEWQYGATLTQRCLAGAP